MLADALCRLAADVPKTSPHRMQQLTRLVRRTLLAPNAAHPAAALSRAYASAFSATRSYATTTRETKPTATVKKTVKAEAAAKPAPKKAASAKKPAANKAAVAKKPAAKKKKKKKTAVKKPAAKKKKTRGRAKKVLTEEEKEKAKIRQYRIKALREPTSPRPVSAYNVFLGEITAAKPEGVSSMSVVKGAVDRFKNLTPAELEHYNQVARQRSEARRAEYQKWIQSHTPLQIRIANIARATLRRKFADQKHGPAHTAKLLDDRHVKLAPTGYILFFKGRHASGDMKNIKTVDATKLIASEWKALSPSEKKVRLEKNHDEIHADKSIEISRRSQGSEAAAAGRSNRCLVLPDYMIHAAREPIRYSVSGTLDHRNFLCRLRRSLDDTVFV